MVVGLVASGASGQTSAAPETRVDEPFHDYRRAPLESPGPTDEPIYDGRSEVAIGWFGPDEASHPRHGDLWTAASLAVEEANQSGGWNGLPYRLVASWSENVWGTGISLLARTVYEKELLAILGSVDGAATHLAEQVVAKALLPLVSPVATDESVNLAGVPWMFSVVPGDHLWAPVLVEDLLAHTGEGEFALVSVTDHDSRAATDVVLEELSRRDRGPLQRLEIRSQSPDPAPQIESLRIDEIGALVVVAGPEDGAHLLLALRQRGFAGWLFGSPQLSRRACLERAGDAARGLRVPALADPEAARDRLRSFELRFRDRTGADPDWAAAHTYDATRLLLAAVDRAGLSRAAVRQALVDLSPWPGVTGLIEWDPTGQNRRPVTAMAVMGEGRPVAE